VEDLRGDPVDDHTRAGEVTFSLLVDNEVVKARGDLSPEDYREAWKAHGEGTAYVSFRGRLKLGHRIGKIENISGFQRVGAPDVTK